MTTGRRRCSPWWTDSSGTHRGQRNHLCLRSCNRCLLSRVAWATRCDRLLAVLTPLDRCRVPRHLRVEVTAHHSDLVATIRRSSVSAAVRWDTRKLAAPNQIHLYHSDRTVGMTGRMDRSDTTADPHRETKYRPGPNPHWPVCHRFGPRFIITRHLRSSPGIFIRLHIPWGINHYFNHRTFSSATIPGS